MLWGVFWLLPDRPRTPLGDALLRNNGRMLVGMGYGVKFTLRRLGEAGSRGRGPRKTRLDDTVVNLKFHCGGSSVSKKGNLYTGAFVRPEVDALNEARRGVNRHCWTDL